MQAESRNPEAIEQGREQVLELGSDLTRGKYGNIYTLTVIGQIEGHQTLPETAKTTKYEHVLPLLAGIEESEEIDGLLLLLNTVGGDIEAGLAIAELIAGMKKPTVSLVLGGGHSIGGLHQAVFYCTHCQHDHSSGADDRPGGRCSSDLPVFPADSGTNRGICCSQFPDQSGKVPGLYDGHWRNGHRCRNNFVRQGSGSLRPHRLPGRIA